MSNVAETHASQRGGPLPRGVLIGAGVLISFALASTLLGRISDIGAVHMPDVKAYQVLQLQFEDQNDGSVLVRDASDGAAIYRVEPGVGGFIRASMRGMARERIRDDIGEQAPFTLTRWTDGTVSLQDKTTGRAIDLDAFGPTNAEAFARLFKDRDAAAKGIGK